MRFANWNAVLSVGLLVDTTMAALCSLPGYESAGMPCKSDSDCCADSTCQAGMCSAAIDLDPVESAYLAHLAVAEVASQVMMVTANLNQASKGIADASLKVSETESDDLLAALKAKADDATKAAAEQYDTATAAAKEKLEDAKRIAVDKYEKAKAEADDKKSDAAQKLDQAMNAAKAKFEEMMNIVTDRAEKMHTMSAKAATGSESYSSLFGDYGKMASAEASGPSAVLAYFTGKDEKAKNDAYKAPGSSSFDYSKYTPKTVSDEAATGGSSPFDYSKYMGGNTSSLKGGAFDYSKFVPSMGGSGSKSTGAGFDYSKYVPASDAGKKTKGLKGSNSAIEINDASKTFSFDKYMGSLKDFPKGVSATFDWGADMKSTSLNNKAKVVKEDMDTFQPGTNGGEPSSGADGSPCGVTPYKDFGKCKKGLHCEQSTTFTKFAPGKCGKKGAPAVNNAAEETTLPPLPAGVPSPGSEGGPCGPWEFAGMHFGKCSNDLVCTKSSDFSLNFNNKTVDFPSICKKATSGEETPATSVENAVKVEATKPTSDDVKHAASKVADAANKAALNAADAAEVLAEKLLAAASKVREAAGKLKNKADNKIASTKLKKNISMASEASTSSNSSSHNLLMFASLLGIGGAFMVYRSRSRDNYERL